MVRRLVAPVLLLVACSESSFRADAGADAGDGSVGQCAPGLKPYGPACMPIFDEHCKDDEVPHLGGGCKKVGVEECELDGVPGIKGPPDWTCKRIGVQECVAPGGGPGLKGPPSWSCQAIGPPTTCLSGWAKTADGWCEPTVPSDKCGPGTMEVIGKSECQVIGDCGSGTWGKIATTASTIFVDASYAGGDSDGSAARPHVTIGAALAAAGSGAQIAVAAGTYNENQIVGTQLTLEGRCPAMVKIVGGKQWPAAVRIKASGVQLRGVTVTGAKQGVRIEGTGVKATLEGVAIEGCGEEGVMVMTSAEVVVKGSLVAECRRMGVRMLAAAGTVEGSVVRDTKGQLPDNLGGYGISGDGTLVVRDSVLLRNHEVGIGWASAGDLTVERTLVAWTEGSEADGLFGRGIEMGPGAVRDTVVAHNRMGGIAVAGGAATLERIVVRDTRLVAATNDEGDGIVVFPVGEKAASVELRDGAVARNRTTGIFLFGATGTVDHSLVVDTQDESSAIVAGEGVVAMAYQEQPAALTLRATVLARNHNAGVGVVASSATVERTVIRDTESSAAGGYGLFSRSAGSTAAALSMSDCLLATNVHSGLSTFGTTTSLRRTIVRDTRSSSWQGWTSSGVAIRLGSYSGIPSDTEASDLLLLHNASVGLGVYSSHAQVDRMVVRDTQEPREGWGRGVEVAMDMSGRQAIGPPGALVLRDALLAENQHVGLWVYNAEATLERSVVRDTPGPGSAIEGSFERPGSLVVRESAFARNQFSGIVIANCPAVLVERSAVRDTHYGTAGPFGAAEGGQGVTVIVAIVPDDKPVGPPSQVTVRESLVSGCQDAGILAAYASMKVERVAVRDTRTDPRNGYGDGITALADPTALVDTRLDVVDCLVEGSARAGLLFSAASGSVRRSVFRKGILAVNLEEAAAPELGDNVYEGNTENRVTWGNKLAPSPMPSIPGWGVTP